MLLKPSSGGKIQWMTQEYILGIPVMEKLEDHLAEGIILVVCASTNHHITLMT